VELVDTQDLKSCDSNIVRVRFPPWAQIKNTEKCFFIFDRGASKKFYSRRDENAGAMFSEFAHELNREAVVNSKRRKPMRSETDSRLGHK